MLACLFFCPVRQSSVNSPLSQRLLVCVCLADSFFLSTFSASRKAGHVPHPAIWFILPAPLRAQETAGLVHAQCNRVKSDPALRRGQGVLYSVATLARVSRDQAPMAPRHFYPSSYAGTDVAAPKVAEVFQPRHIRLDTMTTANLSLRFLTLTSLTRRTPSGVLNAAQSAVSTSRIPSKHLGRGSRV